MVIVLSDRFDPAMKASTFAAAELAFALMLAVSCRIVKAHNGMAERPASF